MPGFGGTADPSPKAISPIPAGLNGVMHTKEEAERGTKKGWGEVALGKALPRGTPVVSDEAGVRRR